jgi:hypothetical protein
MNGYLSRGIVIVDHTDTLENSRIAAIISDLGYPAKVVSTNEIQAKKIFFSSTPKWVTQSRGPIRQRLQQQRPVQCNIIVMAEIIQSLFYTEQLKIVNQ